MSSEDSIIISANVYVLKAYINNDTLSNKFCIFKSLGEFKNWPLFKMSFKKINLKCFFEVTFQNTRRKRDFYFEPFCMHFCQDEYVLFNSKKLISMNVSSSTYLKCS